MTKRIKRTDCHRPGAIIPADYTQGDFYAFPDDGDFLPDYFEVREQQAADREARASGLEVFGVPGVCGVCGAQFKYGAVFHHEPTQARVHMGHDCAGKYQMLANFAAWDAHAEAFKRARAGRLEAERRRVNLAAFAVEHPEAAAALEAPTHRILRDIAARNDGSAPLTEAQLALVLKISREEKARAELPPEAHVDAPEGKLVVEGVVVSKRVVDSDWGSSIKMTVKIVTPAGSWLCWGTCPASLTVDPDRCERGDVVRFTATLKRGRDAHFAVFSRPTKASIVARAVKPEAQASSAA